MTGIGIAVLATALLLIVSGIICLMQARHIIRIILAISLTMKAFVLLIICAGWINGNLALAQAYVITMIVVFVVMAIVTAAIAMNIYRVYGNMDLANLTKLKG